MIAVGNHDRNGKAEEHLQLLNSLAHEIERATRAIAQNSLAELEDSVANQQALVVRLGEVGDSLSTFLKEGQTASPMQIEDGFTAQIRAASETLNTLNHRYSALLAHSSHSVALMVSLFSSFKGQFQEESGPRSKHQTWSCQM